MGADPAPPTDPLETLFEIPKKNRVLGIGRRIHPISSKPSNEAGEPIGRLDGLITMAFEIEQRFDEAPAPVGARVHASRDFCYQRRSLAVFIESEKEIGRWTAIFFTELIDPLDRLQKNPGV